MVHDAFEHDARIGGAGPDEQFDAMTGELADVVQPEIRVIRAGQCNI